MNKTAGEIALELQAKKPDSRDPIEIQKATEENYLLHLELCIEQHRKILEDDFFVVVLQKREKLLNNVFRNYFLARRTCPTPACDQTVFHFDPKDEKLTFLWTVPSDQTCQCLMENKLIVDPSERELLKYVQMYISGELDKKCAKWNEDKEFSNVPK